MYINSKRDNILSQMAKDLQASHFSQIRLFALF